MLDICILSNPSTFHLWFFAVCLSTNRTLLLFSPNFQLSLRKKSNSLHLGRHWQHVWRLGRPTGCDAGLIYCTHLIFLQALSLASPLIMRRCKKTLPRLSAGAESVCSSVRPLVRAWALSHVALYSTDEGSGGGGSSLSGAVALVCLLVQGGRSHTTSDLCSSACHRRRLRCHPASDGCVNHEKHNHFPHPLISTDLDRHADSVRQGDSR